jgi:hypothetical protein
MLQGPFYLRAFGVSVSVQKKQLKTILCPIINTLFKGLFLYFCSLNLQSIFMLQGPFYLRAFGVSVSVKKKQLCGPDQQLCGPPATHPAQDQAATVDTVGILSQSNFKGES